jgi:histone acetyltransferase (RNA polymerase elongator complex component)
MIRIFDAAVRSDRYDRAQDREVAFYGGTFTNLSVPVIANLLGTVQPYLKDGRFQGIRVSTRPDALDEKRLRLMRDLGVRTVELGVQSMVNSVLEQSRRGYTADKVTHAVDVLRSFGFLVGAQLMPGLPGDTAGTFQKTVDRVLSFRPDMVRLYPTVVIRGTALEHWYRDGIYNPLDLEEAVRICRDSCIRFEGSGIPVIRMGLMNSPSLLQNGNLVAGPWHEAFGFLVRSAVYHKIIRDLLPGPGEARRIRLRAFERDIPLLRGHRNRGLKQIETRTGAVVDSVVPDPNLEQGDLRVERLE